jgi:predicted amidohydrolase
MVGSVSPAHGWEFNFLIAPYFRLQSGQYSVHKTIATLEKYPVAKGTRMSMESMKLAAAQMKVETGNVAANLQHSLELIDTAAAHGVDLICFPESILDGYALENPHLADLACPIPSQETDAVAQAAARHGVWVMWTLAEKRTDGKISNTALLFDRQGNIQLHYRKSHLCTEANEHIVYTPGDQLDVIQVEGFGVGAMICFDRHFPEVSRTMRLKGAQLILHPTATDWFTPDPNHINHAMMRTRAYENRCFILSVNQVNYGGGSALYGPWGEVLALAGKEEEILYGEIDRQRITLRPENTFELLGMRRPELYTGWAK